MGPLEERRLAKQSQKRAAKLERYYGCIDNNGDNELFRALRSGAHMSQIEQMVAHGAKWKGKNDHGHKILFMAAETGNVEALKHFTSRGCKVKSKTDMKETILHRASYARRNFTDMLKFLVLEKKMNINSKDMFGNTLILLATQRGRSKEELEEIVKLGGNWEARNKAGETVLHMAAQAGNVAALKYFVSLGADVRARDYSEWTVLHKAILAPENFKDVLELLLDYRLDINACDFYQNNTVFLAALHGMGREGLHEIVKHRGNWRAKNADGDSILHQAVEGGNSEAIKYFVSIGADVNKQTESVRETPIHRAMLTPQENFLDTVETLLKCGADMRAETKSKENLEMMLRGNLRMGDLIGLKKLRSLQAEELYKR